jgi:hypothetical protein
MRSLHALNFQTLEAKEGGSSGIHKGFRPIGLQKSLLFARDSRIILLPNYLTGVQAQPEVTPGMLLRYGVYAVPALSYTPRLQVEVAGTLIVTHAIERKIRPHREVERSMR